MVADKTIIEVAERNIKKYDIVPLYYNMKKAEPIQLSSESIYNGLSAAFSGSNIGIYSNDISKIWNSEVFINGTEEERKEALNVIKLLCLENNFKIDYAKTLYMPERPLFAKELITKFTKANVPHFFKYAKDKEEYQVADINNSFVNKLNSVIPNPRINFRKIGLDKIDYTLLMHNPEIECKVQFTDKGKLIKEGTEPLIIKYHELNKKHFLSLDSVLKIDKNLSPDVLMNTKLRQALKYNNLIKETKEELSQFGYNDMEITDILVKYLYGIKENKHKLILWLCYGDYIYENLSSHLKLKTKAIQCVDCGEWIEVSIKDNRTCRCSVCQKEYRNNYQRILMQEKRRMLAEQI